VKPIDKVRERTGDPTLVIPVWTFSDRNITVTSYRAPGGKVFIIVEYGESGVWQAYMPLGEKSPEDKLDKILQFIASPAICDEENRLGICDYCEHAAWNGGKCEIGRAGR